MTSAASCGLIQADGWSASALERVRRLRVARVRIGMWQERALFQGHWQNERVKQPESITMQQPGLDNRHHDKNGAIARKRKGDPETDN